MYDGTRAALSLLKNGDTRATLPLFENDDNQATLLPLKNVYDGTQTKLSLLTICMTTIEPHYHC